ncbi:MAG: type IV secretion system protein VirB1 [Rhizobiales bacterium 24-66-13]|jgi:type IV secretion system protein VirB1|nr:MAG: type IV secretion system protein VirB1 [Rhizobiales bacterium 35-66-30]OYZ61465.1 MAG: type IV secretion system protein VirB1 [Rhizobiales bacterium 24-66-13]OZA91617.1 MAG: type IV secretion system protein VirB1 [Rhizobiales bacterium 39-66-18]
MPIAFADLAQTCAPTVQVETLAAIVSLESGFSPFAIRINIGAPLRDPLKSKAEAIEVASTLIAERQDVDLGLGGINADGLGRLALTVADAFDPCLNLKATARLLDRYYRTAIGGGARPAEAATVMLQAYYGRGDASLGEMVGYDKQVRAEAKRLAPTLASLTIGPANTSASKDRVGEATAAAPPPAAPHVSQREAKPAPWDVFATGRTSSALVFQNEQSE